MAEPLLELVVALSLDSSNFPCNMRTINQQIKEAESTFRLAGAGVQNYEKAIAGTEAKTYNNTSSVNLSGNNFYVRDEQDIRSLAIEIATLTRRQQRGRGLRMA